MTSFRRPNASIVGSSINLTAVPAVLSGIWDKNEHYTLVGSNNWFNLGGLTMTYNFTSNNATAVFDGVTLIGNCPGGEGAIVRAGGTYSVSSTNRRNGGIVGGDGGTNPSGGNSGAGGSIGGIAGITGTSQTPVLADGLGTALTGIGGYTLTNFGRGGGGNNANNGVQGGPGQNYGGGGGGGGSQFGVYFYQGGAGAGGAIVFQYTSNGLPYYRIAPQSAGAGSYTFPGLTTFVKIWAIGAGSTGFANVNGAFGGGAGGTAWCEFT